MANNTILLKADAIRNPWLKEEFISSGTPKPGHFLQIDSANKALAHQVAGGPMLPLIALEDSYQGKTIDDAYASGDRLFAAWLHEGDEVYGLLANGENVDIGDKLESYGDGSLRKVDTDASAGDIKVGSIIAVAREAVNMSGSSGVDPSGRIKVRITRG